MRLLNLSVGQKDNFLLEAKIQQSKIIKIFYFQYRSFFLDIRVLNKKFCIQIKATSLKSAGEVFQGSPKIL